MKHMVTLSNGTICHISEISYKRAIEVMKQDFRTMIFSEALSANREDMEYMVRKGWISRARIRRIMWMTSEFAGMLGVKEQCGFGK